MNNTATPGTGNWFTLGKVSRTRGLRGEFFLDSSVDRDIAKGTPVRVGSSEYELQSITHPKDRALLKLAGIDTIEAAEAVRDADVAVPREALGEEPMPDDLVGFLAVASRALADAGVPILAICGYAKDHILVREGDLDRALAALTALA